MPDVNTSDFHVVCGVVGVFAVCFSLVSYLIKERLFISESRKYSETLAAAPYPPPFFFLTYRRLCLRYWLVSRKTKSLPCWWAS